ncbi:MAG: hypothetical protein A2516_10720 [Alphaproteobacteria bacterium RIFOXYD12_FULL_60_8]|nr:MAG: hypothetical protein A2516_10720 [Alphaproteobacteria bacterium RIFOXYD12_FULL_60_8]
MEVRVGEFIWDANKNASNRKKHGLSFEKACRIFEGKVVTFVDDRWDYGEVRHVSYGEIDSVMVVVVVHTDRDGLTRVISARKAKERERKKYYAEIAGYRS